MEESAAAGGASHAGPTRKEEPALITALSIDGITHVIQLATAPVFLLTAVGTFTGVLATRLARIVDRTRVLDGRLADGAEGAEAAQAGEELRLLGRRLRLIYLAIVLQVLCGLFVGLVIATAFFDALLEANLTRGIVGLFVLALAAFIGALLVFLREIVLVVTGARRQAHGGPGHGDA